MRDGTPGDSGSPGNRESASCRSPDPRVGSNPTDGTRIDRYADSNEICEQRLVLRTDPDIIYVFIGPHVATLTYAPMLGVAINQLVLRNRHEPRLRLIVKRFS